MREIQPYEALKTALDEAIVDFQAALVTLNENLNHKDVPMFLLFALNDVYAKHAVVEARIEAFAREYGYMRSLNDSLTAQRDEANRKLDSLKRTVNQLMKDDPDPNPSQNQPPASAQNKGRRRKK